MFRKNIIRTPGRYGCPVVTSVIFFWFFISFSFSVVVATFSTIRRFSRPPGLVDDDDDDTTITSCVLSSWGWGENPKCVSKPLNGSSAMVDRTICAHKVPSLLIIEHLHHPIPFGQICTHSYCVVVPRKETLSVSVSVCVYYLYYNGASLATRWEPSHTCNASGLHDSLWWNNQQRKRKTISFFLAFSLRPIILKFSWISFFFFFCVIILNEWELNQLKMTRRKNWFRLKKRDNFVFICFEIDSIKRLCETIEKLIGRVHYWANAKLSQKIDR